MVLKAFAFDATQLTILLELREQVTEGSLVVAAVAAVSKYNTPTILEAWCRKSFMVGSLGKYGWPPAMMKDIGVYDVPAVE